MNNWENWANCLHFTEDSYNHIVKIDDILYSHTIRMNQQTLLNLCGAYLNTNHLTVEDFVELFQYDSMDDVIVSKFKETMTPIREAYFEALDGYGMGEDEPDLDDYASVLARNLQHLDVLLSRG